MKNKLLAVIGLTGAMFLTGPAAADSTVKIELWNKSDGTQGMTLDKSEIKAGKVTFDVTNVSTDMEHELLIVKSDGTPDQLPMKDDGAKVDEGKLQGFDEFGEVPEGQSKSWDTELKPGKYILFCNEEGHFKAGMYSTLTVTP